MSAQIVPVETFQQHPPRTPRTPKTPKTPKTPRLASLWGQAHAQEPAIPDLPAELSSARPISKKPMARLIPRLGRGKRRTAHAVAHVPAAATDDAASDYEGDWPPPRDISRRIVSSPVMPVVSIQRSSEELPAYAPSPLFPDQEFLSVMGQDDPKARPMLATAMAGSDENGAAPPGTPHGGLKPQRPKDMLRRLSFLYAELQHGDAPELGAGPRDLNDLARLRAAVNALESELLATSTPLGYAQAAVSVDESQVGHGESPDSQTKKLWRKPVPAYQVTYSHTPEASSANVSDAEDDSPASPTYTPKQIAPNMTAISALPALGNGQMRMLDVDASLDSPGEDGSILPYDREVTHIQQAVADGTLFNLPSPPPSQTALKKGRMSKAFMVDRSSGSTKKGAKKPVKKTSKLTIGAPTDLRRELDTMGNQALARKPSHEDKPTPVPAFSTLKEATELLVSPAFRHERPAPGRTYSADEIEAVEMIGKALAKPMASPGKKVSAGGPAHTAQRPATIDMAALKNLSRFDQVRELAKLAELSSPLPTDRTLDTADDDETPSPAQPEQADEFTYAQTERGLDDQFLASIAETGGIATPTPRTVAQFRQTTMSLGEASIVLDDVDTVQSAARTTCDGQSEAESDSSQASSSEAESFVTSNSSNSRASSQSRRSRRGRRSPRDSLFLAEAIRSTMTWHQESISRPRPPKNPLRPASIMHSRSQSEPVLKSDYLDSPTTPRPRADNSNDTAHAEIDETDKNKDRDGEETSFCASSSDESSEYATSSWDARSRCSSITSLDSSDLCSRAGSRLEMEDGELFEILSELQSKDKSSHETAEMSASTGMGRNKGKGKGHVRGRHAPLDGSVVVDAL